MKNLERNGNAVSCREQNSIVHLAQKIITVFAGFASKFSNNICCLGSICRHSCIEFCKELTIVLLGEGVLTSPHCTGRATLTCEPCLCPAEPEGEVLQVPRPRSLFQFHNVILNY